jgi:2-polyprenyl-6-methoxyphenol hydroxylase-like FAD-dependent oxidoreductase
MVAGKALIGADGIRSLVRRHLFGDKALRYRGYVGWRGIAPLVPPSYANGGLTEAWGRGGRFGIAPVDASRTYWYASANCNEDWTESTSERKLNLLERFGRWHAPITDLITATPNEQILVSRIYDAPALRGWWKGNVALLGDAAHAMTPNLGQGACLAIEDAWTLGSAIGRTHAPNLAFAEYERARIDRAYSIRRQSRAMGWVVQAEKPVAVAIRNWVAPRLPEFLVSAGMHALFAGK